MSVEHMPDGRLVHYYESVRRQVEADIAGNFTFKRGLKHSPIEWPPEMARKHLKVVDADSQQESDPLATGNSSMISVQTREEMQEVIKNPADQNYHPSLSGFPRRTRTEGEEMTEPLLPVGRAQRSASAFASPDHL